MLGRVEDQALGSAGIDGLRAPQQRVHANEQLRERERLGQVVVAAGVEAAEAVRDPVARAQEEDRRAHAARTQRLAHVAPVGVRQPDVEHQHVRRIVREAPHRLGPGRGRAHREALARQRVADHAAQLVVVLADAGAQLPVHQAATSIGPATPR